MMSGISRYVAVVSLSCGFASALGLSMAHTSVNAQTSAPPSVVPKVPAVAKLAPTPKVLTGTLFNTHEQRERLDRTRLRGGTIGDETVVTAEPERPVINGFVKRSDKRDTVWVDDVMKRDPRAEVVERLEPNMVGGVAGEAVRFAKNTPKSDGITRTQVTTKATTKRPVKKIIVGCRNGHEANPNT
jgi:hypothetical protein